MIYQARKQDSMKLRNRVLLVMLFVLVAALPFCALLYFWPHIPDTVPAHWSANATVNRWGSKYEMFFLPGLSLIFCLVFLAQLKKFLQQEQSTTSDFRNTFSLIYFSGISVFICCLAITAVWIHLVLAGSNSDSSRLVSSLYILPGLIIFIASFLPTQHLMGLSFRKPLSQNQIRTCRLVTATVGIVEAVVCGFILQGYMATYVMIGLFIFLVVVDTAIAYGKPKKHV